MSAGDTLHLNDRHDDAFNWVVHPDPIKVGEPMNQSSKAVDVNAQMLDETVRRVVLSMPDKTVDVVELRSGLARALHDGPTTLFHLFKIGRDLATRTAKPASQRPELVGAEDEAT